MMQPFVVKPGYFLCLMLLFLGSIITALGSDEVCNRRPEKLGSQQCGRLCQSNRDCPSRKECHCDGACGKSCVRPDLRCHPTPSISHGRVDIEPRNQFAAIARYRCNDGYTLIGLPARICQGDERWKGEAPRCELDHKVLGDKNQQCGPPPRVPHTTDSVEHGKSRFALGTSVRYMCKRGFTQQKKSVDTAWCVRGGVWVGPNIACTASGCKTPPSIAHGYTEMPNMNMPGERLRYGCHKGYFLVGSESRTCLKNGQWDGHEPSCELVVCGPPPLVEHAEHDAKRDQYRFMTGTQLVYTCQHGYYREGSQRAICSGAEGRWKGPNMACKARDCGNPGNINNGWRDQGYRFPYPSRVTYHCNEGYELRGEHYRECMANGEWSSSLPECKPIVCDELGPPLHGTRIGSMTEFGSVIRFVCNNGFKVVGSDERTCQADRTWSGQEAFCEEINCGSPGPLPNGYLDGHRTTVGAVYFYRCNIRTKFNGTSFSTQCLENGQWSMPVPKCLGQCQMPEIQKGMVNPVRTGAWVDHGTVIEPTCSNGLVLNDPRPVTCVNGTWNVVPDCVPAPCNSPPPQIENGHRVFFSLSHKARARYFCFAGYRLVDNAQYMTCQKGKWMGTRPMCEEHYCPHPGKLENGEILKIGVEGYFPFSKFIYTIQHGERLLYRCNRDHHLSGPRGAACVNGKWSPQERPECKRSRHPVFNKLWLPFEETNKKPIYY